MKDLNLKERERERERERESNAFKREKNRYTAIVIYLSMTTLTEIAFNLFC